MNSTDSKPEGWDNQDQFVNDFFAIGREIRDESGDLFPGGPDGDLATYYNERGKTRMGRADFEVHGLASSIELEEALGCVWTEEGFGILASFAPRFAEAARALHEVEDESDEVSPLIYVMF